MFTPFFQIIYIIILFYMISDHNLLNSETSILSFDPPVDGFYSGMIPR